MNPTNAELSGEDFKTLPVPKGAPEDYYEPPLSSHSGANYFDRTSSSLFVVIRGSEPVEIRTVQVIEVKCVPHYRILRGLSVKPRPKRHSHFKPTRAKLHS